MKFTIWRTDDRGRITESQEIYGDRLEIDPEISLAVHESKSKKRGWSVSETTTGGVVCGPCRTKAEAILKAKGIVGAHKDALLQGLEMARRRLAATELPVDEDDEIQ